LFKGEGDDVSLNPSWLAAVDPDKLPYLDNVCRESLRYIPPIPMTVRQSLKDDVLGGYHVPSGTVIYVLANTINRLPAFWGDTADEFDPDRWDALPPSVVPNAFMTFLQGLRGRIGRKFAETEMKILLCCLLSVYEFARDYETPDPEAWKMWRLVLRRMGLRCG
jgi:cytochrome P450